MIRLRRHTDGRVALKFAQPRRVSAEPQWCVVNGPGGVFWASDTVVTNPGWSELLVAELPEPDGEDADGHPIWTTEGGVTFIPSIGAVSVGGEEPEERRDRGVEVLKSNALKMLAATAACEQYRAQRETMT